MSAKKVVFVCTHNSCRSQMAEGFARHYGAGVIEAFSAGTQPSGEVDTNAIAVMREKGIEISGQRSKRVEEIDLPRMDLVITMGCCTVDEVCPVSFGGAREEWDLPDPKGQPLEVYRRIRDEIERKVKELVERCRIMNS